MAAADAAEQDFILRSKGGVPDDIDERTLALGEVLIGFVEREAPRRTVLNPRDKAARVVSCAAVHVLLTIAWGGGRGRPEDWVVEP